MDIEIREFDATTISPDATILIVGKRHTGKTTLTRDIMFYMKDKIDLCIGMNPTEMGNHNLEFFIPKCFIFHEFSEKKIQHVLEWQRRCVANDKADRVGRSPNNNQANNTAQAGIR